jgi:hypothetical protein
MDKRFADFLITAWFVVCIGTFLYGLAVSPVGEYLLTGKFPR